MRTLLLILSLPLALQAQPLPLAWPDKPAGSVLYVTRSRLFDGAHAAAGGDSLILAWCDARDGNSRLMAQKFSAAAPAAPGAWSSQVEGLGRVEALVGPVSPLAVISPALAPDGQGGAFLLWSEATSSFQGELRLQQVGDAGGPGAFLWPADLLLADDAPIPGEDCRDDAERCRGLMDPYRRLCADGQGGAWVTWWDGEYRQRLLHVEAGGVPDPDFPADGLVLPFSTWNYQLLADGQGNALLFHLDQGNALWATGVRPNGLYLLHETSRRLSAVDAVVTAFAVEPTGDDRVLAGWVDGYSPGVMELRLQLLDAALQDLWPAGGLPAGLTDAAWLRVCTTQGATPYYLAHSTPAGNVALQLDASGQLGWPQPAPLELVGDANPERVLLLEADEQGLFCVALYYDVAYAQRLDPAGAPLWPAERTRLAPGSHAGWPWGLSHEGPGAWSVGLSARADGQTHVQLVRRDPGGLDLLDPPADRFFQFDNSHESAKALLAGADDVFTTWCAGDSLFLLSTAEASGDPRWGARERPLGPVIPYEQVAGAEVEDGCWVLSTVSQPETGLPGYRVQKVDRAGQVLAECANPFPGLNLNPDYQGLYYGQVLASAGQAYVLANDLSTYRLQALDETGALLWGEAGVTVGGLRPNQRLGGWGLHPAGGVDIGWADQDPANLGYYLQSYDAAGQPRYPDHDGRGRLASLDYQRWQSQTGFLATAEGGCLLALRTGSTLSLQAFDTAGDSRWIRHLSHLQAEGLSLRQDSQGRLMLEIPQFIDNQERLLFLRLTAAGDDERSWNLPLESDHQLFTWCWVPGESQEAVVSILRSTQSDTGLRVRGHLVDEEQTNMPLLFDDLLTTPQADNYPAFLAPAPHGDLWLGWEDRRCTPFGYGDQVRLTRLDVLDLNTAVEAPAQPAAFRLEPNRPNPFNPETTLRFTLAQAGPVRLEIFNLAGQRVRVLQNGELPAGAHSLRFDARDESGRELGSGLYFQRLSAGGQSRTGRMLLVR
ncbi:MAG: FlgD immunoglobulin-like domain containing protein [Candidatus Delongbacteria bacterium]